MYDGFQRGALATPLGIPMIYGFDAVHGHNNVYGATIFPHNIGLGATRDPALVQQIGRATAEEVSGTGVDWTSRRACAWPATTAGAAPTSRSARSPSCPRRWPPIITGLQGATLGGPASVLATAKHYVGDGGTTGGADQGNTAALRGRAARDPPAAVPGGGRARRRLGDGLATAVWNGAKLHGNQYLITDRAQGRAGLHRLRRLRLGRHRPDRRRDRVHRAGGAPPPSTPASTW